MPRSLSLRLLLLALAVAAPSLAGGVEVLLDLRGPALPLEGELVVRSQGDDAAESIVRLEGGVRVEVPADGGSVTCRGEGLWCPQVAIAGEEVTLPVYSTVVVSADLAGRGAGERIASGTVQGVVRGEGGSEVHELRESVPVEGNELAFEAPRAPLDLRFAFPGSAPVYRWGITPPAADGEGTGVDLGRLVLHPGGSLSGWVRNREHDLPVEGAAVVARPVGGGGREASPLHRWSGSTEENGFFQLQGLEPGTYRVELSAEELVAEVLEGVEVERGSETLIGTVLLSSPIRVTVQVSPPLDPAGERWNLELTPVHPLPGEEGVEVAVAEDGTAEIESLRPAEYLAQVDSSQGNTFLMDTRRLGDDEWWMLEVPVAEVEGTVRLGGEPIAATVVLETGNRDRVELASDEDGELVGSMRRPERPWLLVTVTWSEGEESRRRKLEVEPELEDDLVRLDIDLPAGAIFGEVVDAEGRPQPGVRVLATPADASSRLTEIRGETDRSGRFHLTGLDSVRYLLRAGGNGRPASQVVEVDLSGDLPIGDVRLVVWPTRRVEGRVSADGQGVAGAYVQVNGLGRVPVTMEAQSDAQGRFRIELPETVERGVVTVFAPSRLLWSGCVQIEGGVLDLALPTSRTGTLSLVTTGRSDLPPATGGQAVLLTGEGGFVDFGALLNWSRLRNGERGMEQDGARTRQLLGVPGLPPTSYAVTWSAAPKWQLATLACAGAFPELEWVTLGPGGAGELRLDLTEIQRRRLGARGEGAE